MRLRDHKTNGLWAGGLYFWDYLPSQAHILGKTLRARGDRIAKSQLVPSLACLLANAERLVVKSCQCFRGLLISC